MKMRTTLRKDESLQDKSSYEKFFLGECLGVGLKKRNIGENDAHVSFTILVEDDDYWFPHRNFSSSYWLPDLVEANNAAQAWMEKHCKKDGQYGYKFY